MIYIKFPQKNKILELERSSTLLCEFERYSIQSFQHFLTIISITMKMKLFLLNGFLQIAQNEKIHFLKQNCLTARKLSLLTRKLNFVSKFKCHAYQSTANNHNFVMFIMLTVSESLLHFLCHYFLKYLCHTQ